MIRNFALFFTMLFLLFTGITAADTTYYSPGNFNPVLPGYFGDPTVKKFGDTYYIYATTDGIRLASGEPQVWMSKDFVNWYNYEMDITTPLTNCWAPDVIFGPDGKYYYFHGNCEAGCHIYGYSSDSAIGPWINVNPDNSEVLEHGFVGSLPALDQHYFFDTDNSLWVYVGTWISSNGGLGWAQIDPNDMKTILDKGQIPLNQLPNIFEAPFMVKRNNKYIIMYSSGDCQASSYRVQYAYGDSPVGPFTFGENNPILETSTDGTVDGPGHHSVFQVGDNYFIAYHRHDNPHSGGGMFRQVCIDSLIFENDSTIRKVIPTHKGIGYLGPDQVPYTDLAYNSKASASSVYHLITDDDDYIYHPHYAVDNNNGTMWKAGNNEMPQHFTIDLGSVVSIKRIMTQFEYATYYYQYKIEYSEDSTSWALYVDKTANKRSGSPMIDDGDVNARYIRITVAGTEKTGLFAAIWNVKIYDTLFEVPGLQNEESDEGPGAASTKSLLMELNADVFEEGDLPDSTVNNGTLGGIFTKKRYPAVSIVKGVKAINFDNCYLKLSVKTPPSLSWNSAFTVSTWVYNPEVGQQECLVAWSKRTDNLMGDYAALMYGRNTSYGAAAHWNRMDMAYNDVPEAGKWHHIALTFDGMTERIYVNGILDNAEQKQLFVHSNCDIIIGFSGHIQEYFTGSIANLRIYDKHFSADSIQYLMDMDNIEPDYTQTFMDELPGEKSNVNVYYKKREDHVVVRNTNNSEFINSVKLLSIDGKLLSIEQNLSTVEHEFNAPGKGAYIVVVVCNDKIYSNKLIIH
ncbi:MAG: family 43 glycosylhydrolase [Bacteroidales bacterium]|nr:MAG: family 43 glycosylhydrolase [Bacteroidales bacterium]